MTGPQALAQLLAVMEAGAIPILARRIAWYRYPALFTLLASESIGHTCTAHWYGWAVRTLTVPRTIIRAWVVVEVFRFACRRIPEGKRAQIVAVGLALGILLSGACSPFTIAGISGWNQAAHVGLFAAIAWVAGYLRVKPVMENRDGKNYRAGMVRLFFVLAVVGLFGYGGAAWVFVPRSLQYSVWQSLGYWSYSVQFASLVWMVGRMASAPTIATAKFSAEDPLLLAFMAEGNKEDAA